MADQSEQIGDILEDTEVDEEQEEQKQGEDIDTGPEGSEQEVDDNEEQEQPTGEEQEEPEKSTDDSEETDEEGELSYTERLEQRNEAIMEQLNKVTSDDSVSEDVEQKEKDTGEQKEQEEEEQELDFEPTKEEADVGNIKFVDEDDMTELYNDPEKLNNLLNKVFKMSLANTRKVREQVIREVPEIASQQVAQRTKINSAVEDFYKKNPDLKQYKSFVGTVANELQNENPDMEFSKLLEETEREVRQRLKLPNKGSQNSSNEEPEDNPSFGTTPGSREQTQSENRSDRQKQIDELANI